MFDISPWPWNRKEPGTIYWIAWSQIRCVHSQLLDTFIVTANMRTKAEWLPGYWFLSLYIYICILLWRILRFQAAEINLPLDACCTRVRKHNLQDFLCKQTPIVQRDVPGQEKYILHKHFNTCNLFLSNDILLSSLGMFQLLNEIICVCVCLQVYTECTKH